MEYTQEQNEALVALSLKLGALNIRGALSHLEAGPIVTTYYFNLSADIPVAKILKAGEDISLAVGSKQPVLVTRTGAQIAIAIPNKTKSTVSFDACLHSMFTKSGEDYKLPILLGVDTKGNNRYLDLVSSPHVLCAGSTGAGKSVLLASIISGLACFKSKQELKMMLVDTKQLDLTLFEKLPHVVEVADNVEKTHELLNRLMAIVRQRTEKMKGIARNVAEYNRITGAALPYYVVIIDELADVIIEDAAYAKARVEPIANYPRISSRLQGLVQISRASGVHVICATQRPSVKIVTGDIKANFATRIALRLPTGVDSRTIIDEIGAESLLGKGDMLVTSPLLEETTRFHGPFVSMEHIQNVLANCDAIRDSYKMLKLQA
jgi:S-DNA-T family DNA segregation ATPase FtsK/SpoIIIE